MREVQIHNQNKNKIKNLEFVMLLGAAQALIKDADFYSLPVISRETAQPAPKEAVKANLEQMYKITNYDTAVEFLENLKKHGVGWQYSQFVNEWKEKPSINVDRLEKNKRMHYEVTRDFAVRFQPIVGKFGLYGWDIAMGVDIIREVYTAGYFSERVAREYADDFGERAAGIYNNWEQFAIGVICGGAFYQFSTTLNEKSTDNFFDLLYSYVKRLFTDKSVMVWNTNRFMEIRRYFKNLTSRVEFFDPKLICVVSHEVAIEGKPVGYFYREAPAEGDNRDTGWRFFAGNETNRDVRNPDNFIAVTLNIICNYDAGVMPFLSLPVGSQFERNENNDFVPYEPTDDTDGGS
jgi:hypothetical protein